MWVGQWAYFGKNHNVAIIIFSMILRKKHFSYLITFLALMPYRVFAQLAAPSDSYGLVHPPFSPSTLILGVARWILGFVAALTVLVIIVSGILYITSGGDSNRAEKAKGWLINAVIGLIVVLISYVIVASISRALGAQ